MRIDSSNILLGSQRAYSQTDEEKTEFHFWVTPQQNPSTDTLSISQQARAMMDAEESSLDDVAVTQIKEDVSLRKLIAELLAGHKIKNVRMDTADHATDVKPQERRDESQVADNGSVGWGLNYKNEKVHRENEEVGFSAQGIIRTADGKEVKFTLSLEMIRETVDTETLSIRAGDALKDPLVLNFNGDAAQLLNKSFSFDIDSNGTEEKLPGLGQGSSYLAIDVNKNGMIDNGSDLFGPKSGDGFKELAGYDQDRNNWIDENDEVFKNLLVMNVDGDGNQSLQHLSDKGVGAIYLSRRSTQFDLEDQSGLLGRIRTSGIFAKEDGTVGTIQQIDVKT